MRECDECFAILDRPLPENQQLWICYRDPAVDTIKEIRRINSQPDIGTVWELGYLRGWRDLILSTDCELEVAGKWCGRKVLAGFTTTPRDAGGKMNIMLARCLDVVIHGFGELAEWFSHVNATQALADFEERGLAQWKGQVQ
jgi:hypothetical protein